MKSQDKICHNVPIKNEKERQLYKKRQEKNIEGTPKIILGKAESNGQEIWTDQLKNQPISRLKQANCSERGCLYAKKIVNTCCALSQHYGYFMINQNMVFANTQKQIFTWINPDIRENHVKIYLPHTPQGQQAMIKSILNYLKLWFKCDYSLLTDIKHLGDLTIKLEQIKVKSTETFKAKSPEREFLLNRRNSINMESGDNPLRQDDKHRQAMLAQNKSMKNMIPRSPAKESEGNYLTSSLSNKVTSPIKFSHPSSNDKEPLKNRTTVNSDKNQDYYEHQTFNNPNATNKAGTASPLNNSLGVKGGNYYPNRTTSNKSGSKHHIVAMINEQDITPYEYGKNKILLDQEKMSQLEGERGKKKENLGGIGQELDDLFASNIENEQDNQEELKKVQQEFSTLLD